VPGIQLVEALCELSPELELPQFSDWTAVAMDVQAGCEAGQHVYPTLQEGVCARDEYQASEGIKHRDWIARWMGERRPEGQTGTGTCRQPHMSLRIPGRQNVETVMEIH